jgi:hypothetical protein
LRTKPVPQKSWVHDPWVILEWITLNGKGVMVIGDEIGINSLIPFTPLLLIFFDKFGKIFFFAVIFV